METPAAHQFSSESPLPETTTMTVEEFLESDLEGYEYIIGTVPVPSALERTSHNVNRRSKRN